MTPIRTVGLIGGAKARRWLSVGRGQDRRLPLIVLLLLLHLTYSIAPDIDARSRETLFAGASIAFTILSAWLWYFWLPAASADRIEVSSARPDWLDATLPAAMAATACYFSLPNRLATIPILIFVLVQVAWIGQGRYRGSIVTTMLSLVVGFTLAVARTHSIDHGADMLPISVWANHQFLAGHNPYFLNHKAVTANPFFYLPLQWLVFLPCVFFHLDVRILNIASFLAVMGLLVLRRRHLSHPWTAISLMLSIAASRPGTEMMVQGEVWPLWLLVSVFCALYLADCRISTSCFLGLLLAFSQTMILPAALIAVRELRTRRPGEVSMLGATVIAVYATIILPFSHGLVPFIVENYLTLPHLAGEIYRNKYHLDRYQISLANLLARLGLGSLRLTSQISVGIIGIAITWLYRRMATPGFLAFSGAVYIVAVGLNVQVWKYYYTPGLVMLVWGSMSLASGMPTRVAGTSDSNGNEAASSGSVQASPSSAA